MSRVKREHADMGSLAIAVSGYGREEDRNRAFEVGFNEYFVKPLDVDKLQAVLASPPIVIPAN